MEDIGCLWTFQESVDELKQKLQYMTYELEITRKEANEEMEKNNEHVKKLLHLLQTATKERDEAKAQLKKFQQILSFNKPNIDLITPAPFSPDSPLLSNYPARTNSGKTESNSFSIETLNKSQSHVSSPVPVSSPDSTNIGFNGSSFNNVMTTTTAIVDQGSLIIENLAKGRPLPHKGNLLQAVLEAGPLLQTLMVAGSLPRWRNPPGIMRHQIPPVNIKPSGSGAGGGNIGIVAQKGSVGSTTCLVNGLSNSAIYGQISSSGSSFGICPSNMVNFGSGSSSSGSCLMGGRMMPSAVNFDCQLPKRQRIL